MSVNEKCGECGAGVGACICCTCPSTCHCCTCSGGVDGLHEPGCGSHPGPLVRALWIALQWAEVNGDKPVWNNGPTAHEYVCGFVRKTGSYIVGLSSLDDLERFFIRVEDERLVAEVTDILDASCRKKGYSYYQSPIPFGYAGFMAISMLGDLSAEDLERVKVTRGAHGLELNIDLPPKPTSVVSFILDEKGMLVTWYPGSFTAPGVDENTPVKYTTR